MPELSGTVTARSQYGIKVDDSEEWYNWSKPSFQCEPWEADGAVKGASIVATVDGKYILSIRVLEGEGGAESQFPPPEQMHEDVVAATGGWSYEKKDRLMCRESCAKSAVAIFAASITAGIYKTLPDVSAVTAYGAALEKWCLGALD